MLQLHPSRDLDLTAELVARIERPMPELALPPGKTWLTEPEYATAAADLLAGAPEGPIHLFAYGSLIWNPAFEHDMARVATLRGFRRSFCMDMTDWRATPEEPGLMLALDHGGACTGMLYTLPQGDRQAQMMRLLQREIGFADQLPWTRWLSCTLTGGEKLRALVFYVAPVRGEGEYLLRLPEEGQADRLARACGHKGSCAAYLRNTVDHLERMGIHDRYLWRLQRMVAQRITAAGASPPPLAVPPATG